MNGQSEQRNDDHQTDRLAATQQNVRTLLHEIEEHLRSLHPEQAGDTRKK